MTNGFLMGLAIFTFSLIQLLQDLLLLFSLLHLHMQ